jgi:hypothetical protein
MKFIDISGFGHSGKSIITDLLREFNGYQVPHYNFEFNLLRIQGGLLDLKYALNDNWSPIRSDAAIRRFRKLINRIGPSAKFSNPASLFLSNGMNYDMHFKGQFSDISNDYVNSLVNYEYQGEWPYPMIEEPSWKQFYQRLFNRMHLVKHFNSHITVAAPSNFIKLTREYLDRLFNSIKEEQNKNFVMHNAVEPYSPVSALDLFSNARVIIVQRDPRDIYASNFVKEGVYNPTFENSTNWRMKQSFLITDNIERFIERQKIYFDMVRQKEDDNRVLRLQYEDVIFNYDQNINKILNFLEEPASIHQNKNLYFKPEVSKKNIGLWKLMPDQKNIEKIYENLSPYCFNS